MMCSPQEIPSTGLYGKKNNYYRLILLGLGVGKVYFKVPLLTFLPENRITITRASKSVRFFSLYSSTLGLDYY